MKRGFAAACAALLLCAGTGGTPCAAASLPPEDMARACVITVSQNAALCRYLYDGEDGTSWKGGQGACIDIVSDRPIGGLYLIWNSTPVSWTLSAVGESGTAPLGQGGAGAFVHEYMPVAGGPCAVRLCLEGGGTLGSLHVLPTGPVPGWVQRWEPPLDKADLLLASTHADDEQLWFAGTMPVYAGQFGKKVQVSYLIRHGAVRTHELLNGLWTVGVRHYPLIAPFGDRYCSTLEQAFERYKKEDILAWQVELLRRCRPEVVVTQDLNGEYGHGAHRMNSHTLTEALSLAGDASQYPESAAAYGAWTPKKCYVHLYPENQIMMDWDQPLSRFGGLTGMDMAYKGYACHVSQVSRGRYKILRGGKYDNRLFGLYFSTVGPDERKNDFFEHVDPCIPWEGLSPALYDAAAKGSAHPAPPAVSMPPDVSEPPPESSTTPPSGTDTPSGPAPSTGTQAASHAAPSASAAETTRSAVPAAASPAAAPEALAAGIGLTGLLAACLLTLRRAKGKGAPQNK